MGGAAGHMAHLHENTWLTFGEIKSFLTEVASANIEPFEKVDGQNIFFRWTPNGIMCARNDGHKKVGGIDEATYRAKWAGHPAEGAFIKGFEKIKAALENLSTEGKEAFKTTQPNSYRFCNCEIMFPENPNLINYDGNYVVLHNLKEYVVLPKIIETEVFMSGDKEFDAIVTSLADVEKSIDSKEWQLFGPQFVQLNNIADGGSLENVLSGLDALGYSDDQRLFTMVEEQIIPELTAAKIPEDRIKLMMSRIKLISEGADGDDLPKIAAIKKDLTRDQKAVLTKYGSVPKTKNMINLVTTPVAKVISDFAIEVLRGLKSFFVSDDEEEVARIQETLKSSIEKLQAYEGDDAEKMGEMLEKQLEKLGDIENIASAMEGVIFEYPPGSKNLVKLTGTFAMANQIVGRAKRLPKEEPAEVEPINDGKTMYSMDELEKLYEAIGDQGFESVAVIGGAFKPPHLGHLAMVDHYASLADRVKIFISNPQSPKSQRFCGNVCLTAETSLALWNLLLAGRSNVTVEISSAPSPITIAYDAVMPGTPFEPGTTVYLGASVKGGDIKRFAGAVSKADPGINVADPTTYAAPSAELPSSYLSELNKTPYATQLPSISKGLDPKDYSASDLRFLLEKAIKDPVAKKLASYFVGAQNVDAYMNAIGLMAESNKYNLSFHMLS
jgi:hypothetical protein